MHVKGVICKTELIFSTLISLRCTYSQRIQSSKSGIKFTVKESFWTGLVDTNRNDESDIVSWVKIKVVSRIDIGFRIKFSVNSLIN